jgi:hypothetical protein
VQRFHASLAEHPAMRGTRPELADDAGPDKIGRHLDRLGADLAHLAAQPAEIRLAANVLGASRIAAHIPPLANIVLMNSRGVIIGSDATVTIEHVCDIKRPTVEIAELLRYDPDAYWLRRVDVSALDGDPRPLGVDSVPIGSPFSAVARGSTGLIVGNRGTSNNTVHHTVGTCRIDAVTLLANDQVRDALRASQADGLGEAERSAALAHLRTRIYAATAGINSAALLGDWQRHLPPQPTPTVRCGHGRILVINAIGASVGTHNSVAAHVRATNCRVVVR